MGETKQVAEDIVRNAGYTVVRLGNVYGSSGSVVPLWKEQIARGEPVTITDPDGKRVKRYGK
jgi:FlaA1/EpsC-like NDP-sugar epimerase